VSPLNGSQKKQLRNAILAEFGESDLVEFSSST
jgi:hypothetical protein